MPAEHVYEIFIRATPERVWQALTDPADTRQYFHGTAIESDFVAGSTFASVLPDGTRAVDGTVEVFEPPTRLVITWHVLYDAALAAEHPGRVEWRLEPANEDGNVTRVTLRHGDLALSPLTWAHVRLGWVEIIDSLKSLLETGTPMPPVDAIGGKFDASEIEADWHRQQAIAANSSVWDILGNDVGTPDEVDQLLSRAYAAAYHWARASGRTAANDARASWLLSRCCVVVGQPELALHHADQSMAAVRAGDLDDFDLAYAHEARARSMAALGRLDEAQVEHVAATSTTVSNADDREIFESDLSSEPWFDLPV